VLLVTDGRETEGDLRQELPVLRGVGLSIFPLRDPEGGDGSAKFGIVNLYAPLLAPAQKSVEVRVSLANTLSSPERGTLTVTHDQKEVLKQEIRVDPGTEPVVLAASDPSQEGIREIVARFKPENSALPESIARLFVSGQQREKVLLLSGSAEDERFLKQVLDQEAFQLRSEVATRQLQTLGDLSSVSAVILNNIPYALLPPSAATELERFVRQGGGMVMVGGNRSFGLGGYLNTRIAEILPVELVPPQTVKKRLNVAVQLAIDKSGSMQTDQRIDFAKEAAWEVLKNLKDEDYFGVIGFDNAPFIAFPIALVGPNRAVAQNRIGQLFPRGKTNLLPAIDEARRGLVRVEAGRKHVIVLTDGKVPDASSLYFEQVRQMRMLGLTLSSVLVGSEGDDGFLKQLAQEGGGGFYQTSDPRSLPKIFLQDIKVSTGERTIREDTEFVVRAGPDGSTTTSVRSFPPLRGYVQTRSRSGAKLEFVVMGGEKAEPLLASWPVDKGKVVAFTSDASGRWSNFWVPWPRFSLFWSELVNSIRPAGQKLEESTKFDLRSSVERGVLTLDLTLYADDPPRSVKATVISPTGSSREVTLSSAAPGRYLAQIPNAIAGKYEVRLQANGRSLTPVAFSLPGELFGEQRGLGIDPAALETIATDTGGKVNPTPDQVVGRSIEIVTERDLSPWILGLVFLLLLCEFVRREITDAGTSGPESVLHRTSNRGQR
jgi:uncharacterized membrane protein